MQTNKNSNDPTHIALSDLWRLCKKAKFKIIASALGMSLVGVLLALAQPVEYKAEGSFREKSPKSGNINNSIIDIFTTGGIPRTTDNEAISILKSSKIIHPLIQKLNLQSTLIPIPEKDTYKKRFQDNFITTYAYLSKKVYPVLPDSDCPVKSESIVYTKEMPLQFQVLFPQGNKNYQLLNMQGEIIGQGEIDVPYNDGECKFTLTCSSFPLPPNSLYLLTILPLNLQTTYIKNKLVVEDDVDDKSLLKISYKSRDRHLAAKFINSLMEEYQSYLSQEHDRQAALQLTYLKHKQIDSEKHLEQLMQKYAHSLSEDLSKTGFADSQKEMAFLAHSQHELKERLISNELEMKRLQNVKIGKCVYYDQYVRTQGDHSVINSILKEIRETQQQRDSLALALKKNKLLQVDQIVQAFVEQREELKEIQLYLQELQGMIEDVQQGRELNTSSSLFNDKRYLVKAWYQRVYFPDKIGLPEDQEQFLFYLNNLKRLLMVHEKVTKERLIHQQNPSLEFQGVHLKTAQDLYIAYSRKVNDLEAKRREHIFLINQMQDPNFEITSLSTVLDDPVSNDMIEKASHLLLDLKDQSNRSDKEQEQLKRELDLERTFLLLHLQQTNELLGLNQRLMEEKIYALQNMILELTHQHISVLEKNLHDYIETRLENLKQERAIFEQHLKELHQEMASLPKRWVNEKMIEQSLQINELIVQEVAKMVESKNISHKLELIQSAPVDLATLPIHPLNPHLILYATLGALVGGLLAAGTVLRQALSGNLIVSTANLKMLGQQVLGKLSKRKSHAANLDTLRRLRRYFDEGSTQLSSQQVLLIEGQALDYAADLTTLLLKNGKKPLRLFLNFNQPSLDDQPGLLQYLEGKVSFPTIQQSQAGDYIEAGGTTDFYVELLNQESFEVLLNKLSKNYDYIIAVCQATPSSALAEYLATLFSCICITVNNETLNQLEFYFKLANAANKKIGYIMTASDEVG